MCPQSIGALELSGFSLPVCVYSVYQFFFHLTQILGFRKLSRGSLGTVIIWHTLYVKPLLEKYISKSWSHQDFISHPFSVGQSLRIIEPQQTKTSKTLEPTFPLPKQKKTKAQKEEICSFYTASKRHETGSNTLDSQPRPGSTLLCIGKS